MMTSERVEKNVKDALNNLKADAVRLIDERIDWQYAWKGFGVRLRPGDDFK